MAEVKVKCPYCGSEEVVFYGKNSTGKQRMLCKNPACAHKTFQLEYTYNASRPGTKEKIVEMVHRHDLQNVVVYSTFYAKSLVKLRRLETFAELAILDTRVSDCFYKAKGCGASALHPFWQGMDLSAEELTEVTVRAWMSGHLYPEKPTGTKLDMALLKKMGITDIILNEPEAYIS